MILGSYKVQTVQTVVVLRRHFFLFNILHHVQVRRPMPVISASIMATHGVRNNVMRRRRQRMGAIGELERVFGMQNFDQG